MKFRNMICILTALFIGIFVTYATEAQENLFDNPGFEEGSGQGLQEVPGWKLYAQSDATGLISVDTENAIEGEQCLLIEVTGVPAGGAWNLRFDHTERFPALVGETYTISFWIKGDAGPITISPSRADQNLAGQWGNLGSKELEITPEWAEYFLTFTSPDLEDRLVMWQLLISNEGQKYYIDNAKCYLGEYVATVLEPSAVSPSEKLATQWGSLKSK